MVNQAKENAALNGLENAPIRYIVDDCSKFVAREIRRGNKYDAVIMDPPSYGRGPGGETWRLEDNIHGFISQVMQILSDDPLFILVNSYTTGLSAGTVGYLLAKETSKFGGKLSFDELGLKVGSTGGYLPCGASARWER
jgi:23S rRNA (cytosine1962-C5)-methyltransferase